MSRPREVRYDLTWNRRNLAALAVLCLLGGGLLTVRAMGGSVAFGRRITVDPRRVHSAAERIDPNTAGAASMRRLPGIGPSKAERIIAERRRRPYRTPDDLRRVHGIGPKTVEALRAYLDIPGGQ